MSANELTLHNEVDPLDDVGHANEFTYQDDVGDDLTP